MSTNGTRPALPPRHRVLVVGGQTKNIPIWARSAFEIDLVSQEAGGGKGRGKLASHLSDQEPDAIVIAVKFVSHGFSSQAHDLGAELDIPVFKARGGWSTAVEEAARIGTDWFVDAVQQAGSTLTVHSPGAAQEALGVVDNAWKALAHAEQAQAEREREKAQAATRRMSKVQTRLDKVEATYERLRSGAEQRVIAEIQRRAKEMRESNGSALTSEVKEAVVSVIAEFDRAYLAARAQLTKIEERLAEIDEDAAE
ncbi:MAG TPA: hypothetical protein VFH61_17560 [Thermoleophilia bacterium]|nr:hypothetical protein [Thermoleophilia bacterium]